MKLYFFTFAILFSTSVAFAEPFVVPTIRNHVVDKAQVISPEVENQINASLALIKRDTGVEIAVLTLKSLDGLPIEQASMQVVDTWKLGSEKQDNGALLLISMQDRKLRIEVGYGLEGTLTDAMSGRIINQTVVPLIKSGELDRAILAGVFQIAQSAVPDRDMAKYFNQGQQLKKLASGN